MGPAGAGKRLAAVAALVAVAVALVALVGNGEDDYEVTAHFHNATQLVNGNRVTIGGAPIGGVKNIELAPEGHAIVKLGIDPAYAPLRRGTMARIRTTSISSVAGRQVVLELPLEEEAGEEIPDGGELTLAETEGQIDIDQIFNMLDKRTVRDFKRVIQGLERSYEGVAEDANRGFLYMNPLFTAGRRVFAELTADERGLEQLLVNASRFSGALADRAPDVSQMVGNVNLMMNALGDRRAELTETVRRLPNFMREANTTFVHLRAALDDLDPLVIAARPMARELRPFLVELRQAARNAVPTVRDFRDVIRRPGRFNDLVELQRLQPAVRDRAIGTGFPDCGPGPDNRDDLFVAADDDFTQGAFGEAICSMTNGLTNLSFFRAYAPELVGWFDDFSHSGYVDALTPTGRISLTFNPFTPSVQGLPNLGELLGPEGILAGLTTDQDRRCPGANERPAPGDDSLPFTDGGRLTDDRPGNCDPTQLPPGQ